MRLTNNNPTKNAREHYMKVIQKPSGRPQETWVPVMKKDLQYIGLTWENAIELTKNKEYWISVCNSSVFKVALCKIVFTNTYYIYIYIYIYNR